MLAKNQNLNPDLNLGPTDQNFDEAFGGGDRDMRDQRFPERCSRSPRKQEVEHLLMLEMLILI